MEIVKVEPNSKRTQMDLTNYDPGAYFILLSSPAENQILNRFTVIKSQ